MYVCSIFLLTVSFVSGAQYNYLKFREFNSVPKGLEESVDRSFPNTELFIKWENWSCCSACCCPPAVCKQFATSDNCKVVKSVRNRRGTLMVRRKGATGDDTLEDLFSKVDEVKLSDALEIDNIKTDLDNSRISLAKKLSIPTETLSVFQTEDCQNNAQKTDCWELTKCLYGSSNILPEKEVALVEERDVCENASIFVLRDAYNILSLEPEKLYRLQIDLSVGDGNMIQANFTFNGEKVESLEHVRDCAHQPKRIFQHPNGQDVIVRLTEEQLSKNPTIVAVISYQNPARLEIVVDIVLQTKKKEERTADKEQWFSMILISSLAVCGLILLGLSLFFLR
ncbi:unnamed protein product [Caenorhabditis sp. 36 PRJEB53466]|nr:unnamed protein product [Caenorhabditis sp. 36 PRJEB53466]